MSTTDNGLQRLAPYLQCTTDTFLLFMVSFNAAWLNTIDLVMTLLVSKDCNLKVSKAYFSKIHSNFDSSGALSAPSTLKREVLRSSTAKWMSTPILDQLSNQSRIAQGNRL